MKTILIFASASILVGAATTFLLTQVSECRKETRELKTALAAALNRPPPPPPPAPPEPPIEVAELMTTLQRHANKLYFAGKLENWGLADFYVEEIEETAKEFSKKNVMHGSINISGLMGALIVPEIEELEVAVNRQNKPDFQKHYQALITNCNACHNAVNLPFIVVQDPQVPAYDNQRYEPVIAAANTSAVQQGANASDAALAVRPADNR